MFALAALAVTLLSAERGSGCKEKCVAYVTDPRLRANVCGRCFTEADRGAWAAALAEHPEVTDAQLDKILDDPDWKVRWGAVRSLARRKAVTDARVLTEQVTARPDRACSTALHIAGAKKLTVAALIQPQAAALCWDRRTKLVPQLELEMYSEVQTVRLEAVQHLAAFLERPITRVVLDAMKSRASETDDLSAGLLVEACHLGGPPAGKALLDVKKAAEDEALVNRLLAVWSRLIDGQRKALQSEERGERRNAIAVLADLAPLSAPELEGALDDADASNRRAAAEALAHGEGLGVASYAKKKLDPGVGLPTRLKWVAAIGVSQDSACSSTLRSVLRDEKTEPALRAAALPALADCEGGKALATVAEAQSSKVPELRAGAALALANLPRESSVARRLDLALGDADPKVLAAAARAAGKLRQRSVTGRLVELVDHDDAEVRREAVLALAGLETPAAVPRLMRAVAEDGSAPVREAAARALGDVGSAAAVPVLITASERDADAKVKFVAAESLRKLGFKRSSGSMSP